MKLKTIDLEKEILKDKAKFKFKDTTYDKYLSEMKKLIDYMKTTNIAPTDEEIEANYRTIFMIIKNYYGSKGALLNRYIGEDWVFSTNKGKKHKGLKRVESFLREEDRITSLKSGKEVCFLTKKQIIEQINFSTFNIKDVSKQTDILFMTKSLKSIVLAIDTVAEKDIIKKEDLIEINKACIKDFKDKKNNSYMTINKKSKDIFGFAQLLGFKIR